MGVEVRVCFACAGEGFNLVYITDYDGEIMKEGRTTCVICGGKGEWNGPVIRHENTKANDPGSADPYASARRMFRVLEGGKSGKDS